MLRSAIQSNKDGMCGGSFLVCSGTRNECEAEREGVQNSCAPSYDVQWQKWGIKKAQEKKILSQR